MRILPGTVDGRVEQVHPAVAYTAHAVAMAGKMERHGGGDAFFRHEFVEFYSGLQGGYALLQV